MIIPEPPASVKCATCSGTPEYVWLPRMQRWVGLVPDGDGRLRVHDCRTPRRRGKPPDLSDVRAAIEAASAKYRTDKPAGPVHGSACTPPADLADHLHQETT